MGLFGESAPKLEKKRAGTNIPAKEGKATVEKKKKKAPANKPRAVKNKSVDAAPDAMKQPKKERPAKKLPERIRHKETLIDDTVTRAYGEDGKKDVLIDPKGNLRANQVSTIYTEKRLKEKKVLRNTKEGQKEMTLFDALPDLRSTPIDQIRELQKRIIDIGGEEPSSRKVLAEYIAKLLQSECDLAKMSHAGSKELIPLFKLWTWLDSNGFVLGDEKKYYGKFGSESKKKEKQEEEAGKRAELLTAYKEGGGKEALVGKIMNAIGKELDYITRWAYNTNVEVRRQKYRKDRRNPNAPIPRDFAFMKLQPENDFPDHGLLAHLTRKKDLQQSKDEVLALLYGHTYLRYIPLEIKHTKKTSRENTIDKPKKEQQKRAEKTGAEPPKKLTPEEQMLATLRLKMGKMEKRMAKAAAIVSVLDKDDGKLPGKLRFTLMRLEMHVLTQQQVWMDRALRFLPEREQRSWVGRILRQKNVPALPVERGDFDSLTSTFDNLEKRQWRGVEANFREVLALIPQPRFLDKKLAKEFTFDTLTAESAREFAQHLKKEFYEPKEAQKQPSMNGEKVLELLLFARDQLRKELGEEMERVKAASARAPIQKSKKKPRMTPLADKLDKRVKYLDALLDMKNKKFTDKQRAVLMINAYNRYRGRRYTPPKQSKIENADAKRKR